MMVFRICKLTLLATLLSSSLLAQETLLVSQNALGEISNGVSELVQMSGNGRFAVFSSTADNLVPEDQNGAEDVFVFDLATGLIELVSTDSGGTQGNRDSGLPSIDHAGRYVAFSSDATNLVPADRNGTTDCFVKDRETGTLEMVSVNVWDQQGDERSWGPEIDPSGQWVAFISKADNLVFPTEFDQIYLRNLITGEFRLITRNGILPANGSSVFPDMSWGASIVVFQSLANDLVENDSNGHSDIFAYDLETRESILISRDAAGIQANHNSREASIDYEGRYVGFESRATNLVARDTNGVSDAFVKELESGFCRRVSVDADGREAPDGGGFPELSGDGQWIVLQANQLVPEDNQGGPDVYRVPVSGGSVEWLSRSTDGDPNSGWSRAPSTNQDGLVTAFTSSDGDLVPNDQNGMTDIFMRVLSPALAESYGVGYEGSLGVPELTLSGRPHIGSNATLSISNSSGSPTTAFLLWGFSDASISTHLGGTLWVEAQGLFSFGLDSLGLAVPFEIVEDMTFLGTRVHCQVLELDPGATHGVSFSKGLSITFGY